MGHGRRRARTLRCTAFCLLLATSACAPRGSITIDPTAAGTGAVHHILVASTRAATPGAAVLSRTRADDLRFLDVAVSVPPDRAPGTVTFPVGPVPNPATDFVTVAASHLKGPGAFRAAVDARAATLPPDRREALVFVHGYNTTFAEGLYRQAQMTHDFGSRGVSVHYAWPSAGDFRAYAVDRESALFARDGLETVLETLARSDVARIIVIGHSMGAQVLMDTLRQMAIRDAPGTLDKLASVVLLSPDLDIDVFRTQAMQLAGRDIPIYVFASSGDRALRLSALLRGRQDRLGSIRDMAQLDDLSRAVPLRVMDVTEFDANQDPLQHFKALSSKSMIALFGGLGSAGLEMFRDADPRAGPLQRGLQATQEVAGAVLGLPAQR